MWVQHGNLIVGGKKYIAAQAEAQLGDRGWVFIGPQHLALFIVFNDRDAAGLDQLSIYAH